MMLSLPFVFLCTTCASAYAHAFTGQALADLKRHSILSTPSSKLLGDLVGRPDNLTAVGTEISAILTGKSAATGDDTAYTALPDLDSPTCAADTCCKWAHIVSTMHSAFTSPSSCTSLARGAIRLGFHDAAAWNVSLPYGGADGSIVLNAEENDRPENRALKPISAQTRAWFARFRSFGISMADLIQMGAATAVVTCPGGPRIRSFVGREDGNPLPPEGLLPSAFADAETNIALFEAKTFSASDLVALVGAHTVSQQVFVDPARAGAPQDSSDSVWDTKFYEETAGPSTPPGVFTFPSDASLANSSETSGTWRAFAGSLRTWNAVRPPREITSVCLLDV